MRSLLSEALDAASKRPKMGVRKAKDAAEPAHALLQAVSSHAEECLGSSLAGIYLFGSLALGDFDPDSSDVDLLVVTELALDEEELACLSSAHEKIFASKLPLAGELEVTYVSREALRSFAAGKSLCFRVDRGSPKLRADTLDVDWLINFYALHQGGRSLMGPKISSLIPEVTPEELRHAMVELNSRWWAPIAEDPERLVPCAYRYYAVLTMARMLATREKGKVVSKKMAADWAAKNLEPRWATLVKKALNQDPTCTMEETREFIRFAVRVLAA